MKAREKADELRRMRAAEKASGVKSSFAQASTHYSAGFGSSHYQSSTSSFSSSNNNTDNYDSPPATNYSSASSSAAKPNKAMKLGTSKDQLPAFIEQQVKQAMPASVQPSGTSAASLDNPNVERVHLKVDEKVSMTCGKDGGVQNLEVLGVLFVRVAGEEDGKIRVALRNNDTRNLLLQTNPNVDKTLFKNQSVIGLKEASKSFPVGTDVGVLKWKFQTQDDTEIPLTSNIIFFYVLRILLS